MIGRFTFPGMLFFIVTVAQADDWPQWMGSKRDGHWRESGILSTFPKEGPKLLWKTSIAGGYSGPSVAQGRVYVTDFLTDGVRKNDPGERIELQGKERLHCLDIRDGKTLWTYEYPVTYKISYPAGPRATPTVVNGKVYMLGAEGNLASLDASTGKVLWSKDLKKEYKVESPIWGFCSHPLIDNNILYLTVGGEGTVAVALDATTGKQVWTALSASEPGYAPTSIIQAGNTPQLIVWHADAVNSLDPKTGKVYWTIPLKPNYGMAIMAPQLTGNQLFAGGIGVSILLELDSKTPAAKELWRGDTKRGIECVNSTPIIDGDHLFGVNRFGQLRCVELATGKHIWESFAATTGNRSANSGTAFLIKNDNRYFIFSETGDLVIAKLTPEGYQEQSRAHLIDPSNEAFGREVVWSHPAFANKSVFVRNDKELIAYSLAP
jgi:outer membrane protein assembly factor BamB